MANYKIRALQDAPMAEEPSLARRGSFFGHDPALEGLVPAGSELPAHLVLTLDNNDARIAALGIDVGPMIRLVHPFHHSEGDMFTYHHRHGDRIEFAGPLGPGDASWPREGLPATFPTRKVEIAECGGKPERAFGECALIYVGSDVPTVQDISDGIGYAACSTGEPRLFASVPSQPLPGLDLWGGNDFVFALFWYCPDCKAITTHNETD